MPVMAAWERKKRAGDSNDIGMHIVRVTALRDLIKSEYKQEKLLQAKVQSIVFYFHKREGAYTVGRVLY